MKIGVIGAGSIGRAFATQAIRAGYEVIMSNSRGPESLSEIVKELGDNVSAGSVQDAANADVVFLAVIWQNVPKALSGVSSWEGRILIDATNPILVPGYQMADVGEKASSEIIAEFIPGAKVVKAFNTMDPVLLATDPSEAGGKRVVFFCGDDVSAKSVVAGIIDKIGFAGVDLGSLNEGAKLQQYPTGPLPGLNLIRLK